MRLNPMDILEKSTVVTINGKRGEVVSHKIQQALPCGTIVIHTVLLTHKYKRLTANRHIWELLPKPIERTGNYSAIDYSAIDY